jgi:hypothetical protein
VLHRPFSQFFEIDLADDFVEIRLRQISRRPGSEVQGRRFQSDGTDRVVRAMIAPHLIDRQNLDKPEPDLRRPIDELPQTFQIADAEIALRAQGKERRQYSRDLLLRRQIHTSQNGHQGGNGCLVQPRRTCQSSTSFVGISFKKREGRWNMSP